MTRLFFALILLTVGTLGLSGCNTIEGVGQDLTSLGKTMKGE